MNTVHMIGLVFVMFSNNWREGLWL